MDSTATTQLRIIKEIATAAQTANIPLALRGGWALDFLLGRITRPHGDIDLNAWIADVKPIERLLESLGYENEGEGVEPLRNFHAYGQTIQVAFLEKMSHDAVCPAGYPEYCLSMGLMEGSIVALNDVRCRTATVEAQLDVKEQKLWWDPGESYSDKALADMKLMKQYMAEQSN